jgi:hypothetical protein
VFVDSIVIVGGTVASALAGMLFVRRKVPLATLREHNEVAGFIIGVVGVAFAVLLAFVVLTVWEQFEEARQIAAREANALAGVFRLSQGFSGPERSRMLGTAYGYAELVTTDEWQSMGQGARSTESPGAWKMVDRLWEMSRQLSLRTPREQALYSELLGALEELSSERKLRLMAARNGLPALLWVVLILGAAVTVAFSFFFGVRSMQAHALMTGALAGTIALNLYLIAALDYPFSGDLRVPPEAFEQALVVFDRIEGKPAQ